MRVDMNDPDAINKIKDIIVDDVRERKPEAVDLYKVIAKERTDVWVDDVSSVYVLPRRDWLLTKIRSVSKNMSSPKILDVGSWTGGLANFLYEKGYTNITCLDISKEVVNLGSRTFPNMNWICEDIDTWDSPEKYDIILMCEVLEHVLDPFAVVEKARKWLNLGGCIIYTIPSEDTVFGEKIGNNSSEHISKIGYDYLKSVSSDVEHLHAFNNGELTYDWYVGSISNADSVLVNPVPRTNVLIAIPTAKNIETDTFKSIYRLLKPYNCDTYLECFYGYRIDQIRNLACHFAMENNFDYIFFVDSDIILPPDSLIKLLAHDKDVVAGVYRQRIAERNVPEIYVDNGRGGMTNIQPKMLIGDELLEVRGCGMGCTLIKTSALKEVGYPQFLYHHAIDHKDTVSEDVDFCMKVTKKGMKIYADSSIKCGHIGTITYSL